MKDCTTCKYGFVDEQLGFPMCHHPSRFSEDCVDFNMHEDKEEPEKATGIEEKKLPEGLEEAAHNFALHYDNGTCDGIAQDCFIAGAEWQKAKMLASEELEEEIKRMKDWWEHNIGKTMPGFENNARYFAEWGAKHLKR